MLSTSGLDFRPEIDEVASENDIIWPKMIGIALRFISTIELDIYQFPVQPEVGLKWLLSLNRDSI